MITILCLTIPNIKLIVTRCCCNIRSRGRVVPAGIRTRSKHRLRTMKTRRQAVMYHSDQRVTLIPRIGVHPGQQHSPATGSSTPMDLTLRPGARTAMTVLSFRTRTRTRQHQVRDGMMSKSRRPNPTTIWNGSPNIVTVDSVGPVTIQAPTVLGTSSSPLKRCATVWKQTERYVTWRCEVEMSRLTCGQLSPKPNHSIGMNSPTAGKIGGPRPMGGRHTNSTQPSSKGVETYGTVRRKPVSDNYG